MILDGAVEISRNGSILHVAKQNEVLGSWALFDDSPLPVIAKTLEDTALLRISRDDFYDLLSDNMELATSIFSTLVAVPKANRAMNTLFTAPLAMTCCIMGDVASQPMSAEDRQLESQIKVLEERLATAKQQLIDAHHMISVGMLLAGIVHEINTPIGSIVSNNEVSVRSLVMLKEMVQQAQSTGSALPPKASKILETLLSLAAVDKIACERIMSVIRSLKNLHR